MVSVTEVVFGNRYKAVIAVWLSLVMALFAFVVISQPLGAGPGMWDRRIRALAVLVTGAAVLWAFLWSEWKTLDDVVVAREIVRTTGALSAIALCSLPIAYFWSVPLAFLFAALASSGWGLYLCYTWLWSPRRPAATRE